MKVVFGDLPFGYDCRYISQIVDTQKVIKSFAFFSHTKRIKRGNTEAAEKRHFSILTLENNEPINLIFHYALYRTQLYIHVETVR